MKKQLLSAAVSAALLVMAHSAHATNGDQMLGVTATQWGMGGAVVAAPQDAGTILTNPAGIAELGIKEVRFDMGVGRQLGLYGHDVEILADWDETMGHAHCIVRHPNGVFEGGADPRSDGSVAAF